MMDSTKLFGIDLGYLIVAVALATAGIVFILWLRKRGPKTAKGVHHNRDESLRQVYDPKKYEDEDGG